MVYTMPSLIKSAVILILGIGALYYIDNYFSTKTKFKRGREVTVWKNCRLSNGVKVIVELLVTSDAKRVYCGSSRGRIEFGLVKSITDYYGNSYIECESVDYRNKLIYRKNEFVFADRFDLANVYYEDAHGIYVSLDKDYPNVV